MNTLFLERFGNGYCASNGSTNHGVVTHSDKSHHFNMQAAPATSQLLHSCYVKAGNDLFLII